MVFWVKRSKSYTDFTSCYTLMKSRTFHKIIFLFEKNQLCDLDDFVHTIIIAKFGLCQLRQLYTKIIIYDKVVKLLSCEHNCM